MLHTDILIEYVRGNTTVRSELKSARDKNYKLCTTPITVTELYAGLRKNEEPLVLELLALLKCIEITENIGKLAGTYLNKFEKSHQLQLADALIAATAAHHDFLLCTYNWKHYPMKDIRSHVIKR